MRGLDPRIHLLLQQKSLSKQIDRRVKPGDDDREECRSDLYYLPAAR
jgi:hypothetical protein